MTAAPELAGTGAPSGLTEAQVEARRLAGQINRSADRSSRTYRGIVAGNVFTRFNLIISVLGSVVLLVGQPADALFVIVMVVNATVGIVQEVRAKRTLDRLRILVAPVVTVRRDGNDCTIAPDEVVVDDLIILGPGDQVPVDGILLGSGRLEVDESALSGESDPVAKADADDVWSGSVVIAGAATMRSTRVGQDAWIHRLIAQAKEFAPATSELRSGVDDILRVVGWVIGPLAVLLVWSQLRSEQTTDEALISAVAGVVGLVPQGLVLLVSMALAVAVIRLAREHVVVQELHAVEGLARIDVFCVDKTGTLTTGAMAVSSLTPLDSSIDTSIEDVAAVLRRLASAEPNPTATLRVIADELGEHDQDAVGLGAADRRWQVDRHVPFSSVRKWSGATFRTTDTDDAMHCTWILGAPEVLLDRVRADDASALHRQVSEAAAIAGRVVLLASARSPLTAPMLPDHLSPRALIVLAEEIRPDAASTMAYFRQQHVDVKVISGDNARTVAAVAAQVGIDGADRWIDMREFATGQEIDRDELRNLVANTTVFGRVLPEQKRAIVEALQADGHVVAMTGDGVNDIPALKRADIGVAMDTATPATRAISQVVLLDGRFDRMPHVVAEGRRVVENMERVSKLFVTKTVYAAVFALTIGASGAIFPFLPRQMSLVSELTIGLPAFVLSFRAADRPCRRGYRRRVFRFAVPAGLAAASVTLLAYWTARLPTRDADLAQARTASTLALVAFAFWVLYVLMQPVDRLDRTLMVALVAVFLTTIAIGPLRRFYRLDWPPALVTITTMLIVVGGVAVAQTALGLLRRR